jgi:hypothetical protein
MREALLVNPFNLKQGGSAKIVNLRASRSTPVCSNCQSDDVISHAIAQWSNESQEWQLAAPSINQLTVTAATVRTALSGYRSIIALTDGHNGPQRSTCEALVRESRQ